MADYKVDLFTPHEGQWPVIEQFSDSEHKFGIVATGRQFGKSLLGQNLLLYWLLQNKGSKGAWIAPIYNQSRKVFKELVNAASPVIVSHNKAELTCKFINGAELQFLSAERPDSIRGFSFDFMVIDEAAFIKEEALYEAILPTLTALGKKCLIISTPKGKGWFYEYYLRGNTANNVYISFTGISETNPHVDREYIDVQRKSLPPAVFEQEYLAKFKDAGNDVFIDFEKCAIVPRYEQNKKVYLGIDTGLSADKSVLCLIDESGRVQYMEGRNGENITDISNRFISLSNQYTILGGYIETNGIGRAMYDLFTRASGFRNVKPFTTTQDSKTKMVRKLIADFESGMIELPTERLEPTLHQELSLYTYKQSANGKLSFSHPNGFTDDYVDALMLANLAREELIRGGRIHIGNMTRSLGVKQKVM